MAPHSFFLCTLLTFSTISCYGIAADMKYEVIVDDPNHPGSVKFNEIIGGIPYAKEIMGKINDFIWSTVLKQNTTERKAIYSVELYISKHFLGADAVRTGKNKINVSAHYLNEYKGDVKWQFTSLMHHQMSHLFQWSGRGRCPVGLNEGVADYTMLKANYAPPDFAKRGEGDKWDKGYDYTARFLEYCDEVAPDFVANLNKMMRRTYNDTFFETLTGKSVDQLWKEYKAKYAQGAENVQH